MNAYPFSVFKRADRPFFLVAFKDDATGKYLPPLSTKKATEKEAMQVAFGWLRDGIPQKKKNKPPPSKATCSDLGRYVKTQAEAELLLEELRRRGLVSGFSANGSAKATDFVAFLTELWDWDTSPYVREKLRRQHGIHRRHCQLQGRAVVLYWVPYIMGRQLEEITAEDIGGFIDHLAGKDLSAARKNLIVKAGTMPLR